MAFLIKGGNSADENPDDQFLMQAEMRYAERMKKKSKYKGQIEVIFSRDDSIDTDYFVCNDTLRYIEIEECVDTIFSAFNCCIALQRVIFPKTINYIWDYSFKDCESLKSIELPKGLGGIPASIPVCRYGDEKMISELLRDIKIQHQSVRSILPKIVRKALKLSDYYEALRDIDIIDNENE